MGGSEGERKVERNKSNGVRTIDAFSLVLVPTNVLKLVVLCYFDLKVAQEGFRSSGCRAEIAAFHLFCCHNFIKNAFAFLKST